jgi:hypothetical protein
MAEGMAKGIKKKNMDPEGCNIILEKTMAETAPDAPTAL